MNKQQRIFIIIISIFTVALIVDIGLRCSNNIHFQSFTLIFNNLLTPLITAAAVIVYYLSLVQIRKQTNNLKEEKDLLIGENIFKDISLRISEIKTQETENKLDKLYNITDINQSLTVLTIYSGIIIDYVKKLKEDINYIDLLELSSKENTESKTIYNSTFFSYYIALNSTYHKVEFFLEKVLSIIDRIEKEENLHESQKKLLIKLLGNELLGNYFSFIMNKNHFDYSLIPCTSSLTVTGNYQAFDFHHLESVFNIYKNKYPKIFDEVNCSPESGANRAASKNISKKYL